MSRAVRRYLTPKKQEPGLKKFLKQFTSFDEPRYLIHPAMRYEGICSHDDGYICEHRLEYIVSALLSQIKQDLDKLEKPEVVEQFENGSQIVKNSGYIKKKDILDYLTHLEQDEV